MTPRTHLDDVFEDLQKQGLNQVHATMAQNIIDFRIRGNLPYTEKHKTDILARIEAATPDMVAPVAKIFKNVGK